MNVTIAGPNLTDQSKGEFVVHATGCADLKRGSLARDLAQQPGMTLDVERKVDVEAFVYDFAADEHEGYQLGDWLSEFHFAPCCDQLPKA